MSTLSYTQNGRQSSNKQPSFIIKNLENDGKKKS
jgi:hypothetical protein